MSMRLFNRKAKFEYALSGEGVEAGISLKGMEAKAIREGHGDISNAFVRFVGNEAFLVNANVPVAGAQNYDSTRTRKLLMHKKEILSIATKMKQKSLQAIPISLYNKGRLIKLYIELGKSKRKFEKKEAIKKRDMERDIEEQFRGKL